MSEPKHRRSSSSLTGLPKPKWWGQYVADDSPGGRRFVFRWRRILAVLASIAILGYFSCVTVLWGYYSLTRGIPGIYWIDIAVPGRFGRVERTLAAFHFSEARKLWDKKDFGQAILSARSAVAEDPHNLEARLFLAERWSMAGRFQEAVRVLRNGIEVDANAPACSRRSSRPVWTRGSLRTCSRHCARSSPPTGCGCSTAPRPSFRWPSCGPCWRYPGRRRPRPLRRAARRWGIFPPQPPCLRRLIGSRAAMRPRRPAAAGKSAGPSQFQRRGLLH